MFLEILNDVLKTFYIAAKRFDKHPNIYILSSQEIGISKKINATSEKKSDKNYVFILGPLKSSFLSRFCFYFSFLTFCFLKISSYFNRKTIFLITSD